MSTVARKRRIVKAPEVIAWEAWLKSEIGQRCQETMRVQGEYLQNRLWHAFMDGFRAGRAALERE